MGSGGDGGEGAPRQRVAGSVLVAAGIGLSRISGLVREVVIAAALGTSPALDAFRVALRIPNTLQNLLGEGVLSAAFIPTYARLLEEGREREAGAVASTVASALVAVCGVAVGLALVFADGLATVLAPGFEEARQELTALLIRITAPGVAVLVLSAWALGILNSHRRFFLSYVAPVLWNAAQVVALAAAAFGLGIGDDTRLVVILGWATVAGAAAQLGVQIPTVLRLQRVRPRLRRDPHTVAVAKAFLPVVGARGVVQVSAWVDLFLASFLVAGAPTVLGYAQLLYLLPISLFGMSVAAAELPELARGSAPGRGPARLDALRPRVEAGLRRMAVFVVPIAVAYLVAGDLVVGALFQRGAFGRLDTLLVWAALGGYAIGLTAATGSRLLQSALYAVGDARTPARASVTRVAVSATLGALLMFPLDRFVLVPSGVQVVGEGWVGPLAPAIRAAADPHLGVAGLTLAAGVAAWAEFALLARGARARVGPVRIGGGRLPPTLLAATAAAVVVSVLRLPLGGLPPLPAGVVALSAAGATYLAVLARLDPDALRDLRRLVRRS